jgi:hypothetical protein
MAAYAFVLNSATAGLKPEDIYLDISTEIPLATDSNALVNRVADKLQGGALSSELRTETVAAIERIPASVAPGRVAEAIYSIVTSPEYAGLR